MVLLKTFHYLTSPKINLLSKRFNATTIDYSKAPLYLCMFEKNNKDY